MIFEESGNSSYFQQVREDADPGLVHSLAGFMPVDPMTSVGDQHAWGMLGSGWHFS